jgi:hypothetical protein
MDVKARSPGAQAWFELARGNVAITTVLHAVRDWIGFPERIQPRTELEQRLFITSAKRLIRG